MKIKHSLIILVVLTTFWLSACIPLTPPAQNQVSEAYIQTAVASTLVAERAKEAGAALSISATGEEDTTTTPEEGETTDPEVTLEPQPTVENPWMLQSWCEDHPNIGLESLQNRYLTSIPSCSKMDFCASNNSPIISSSIPSIPIVLLLDGVESDRVEKI